MEPAGRTMLYIWLAGTGCCALMLFMIPGASACDRCLHKSKVAYNAAPLRTIPGGACGYGSFGGTLSRAGAVLATAGGKLYRGGVGCGACYQIRCTNPAVCTKSGVKVVVTDVTGNNQTDFVLPVGSFSNLARTGRSAELVRMGVVDVEYKRIVCEYPGRNLAVRVDRSSNYPYYLAVQFWYQGGQTDISAVEVARMGSSNWHYMTRKYGAVWGVEKPPEGPLSFRLLVTGGYDGSWVWPKRNLLPANWKPGAVYDSGVQIREIAQEGCSPCETEEWKDP